jgi:hypothetical protein
MGVVRALDAYTREVERLVVRIGQPEQAPMPGERVPMPGEWSRMAGADRRTRDAANDQRAPADAPH